MPSSKQLATAPARVEIEECGNAEELIRNVVDRLGDKQGRVSVQECG